EFCGRNSDVHRGLVTGQTAAGKWTHLGEGARHLPTRKLGYGSLEIVQAVAERPERRLVVLAVDGDIAGRAHDRSWCPLIRASKFRGASAFRARCSSRRRSPGSIGRAGAGRGGTGSTGAG